MLAVKLWYFLYFSGSSCLYPYFNILLRRKGLHENQIGLIAGLRPWISFPAGIVASGLADVWRRHRSMMVMMLGAGTVVRALILYTNEWAILLSIMLLGDAIMSPVTILADSVIAACPGEGEYGKQRLWGAVGWGMWSFVAGETIERVGFVAVFVLNAFFMACTAAGPSLYMPWQALESKLNSNSNAKQSLDQESSNIYELKPYSESYFQKLIRLLSLTEAIIFFVQVTVMGYAVGTIEGFLFLYLEDLGGTETLMGLTLTVTCVSETMVFYCMGHIQQRVGLDACFHICFLAFAVRLLGYILLSWLKLSPWAVLPLELLHGITFGMTWSVGTTKSALIAPPGLESTSQSAFQGLMFGLGHGIGGSVSGLLYRSFLGQSAVFGMALCVICLGWVGTSVAGMLASTRRSTHGCAGTLSSGESTHYTRAPVQDIQLQDLPSLPADGQSW